MVSPNLLSYNIQNTVMNTTIKHPRMVNPGTAQTFIRQETNPGGLEVHTTDAEIEIDTTAARESMGLGQLSDRAMIEHFVEKGKQAVQAAARRDVKTGTDIARHRTTRLEALKRDYIEKHSPKDTITVFYPGVPAEVDIKPGTTDISHHPTEVNIDWADTQIVPYELERGTVNFDIVRRAYVDITYLGDPNYFPEPKTLGWA